ncbi:MAG: hypothetical protein SF029_23360 [bacterium]|nr:hypothetical protein [bacterium]
MMIGQNRLHYGLRWPLTVRLWRRLRTPPDSHPLFQRVSVGQFDVLPCMAWGVALILAPLILLPALLLIGVTYGMIWSVGISQWLSKEKVSGRYDLLVTLPGGALGLHWLAGASLVHRNMAFERIHNFGLWFARVIFAIYLIGFQRYGGTSVFMIGLPHGTLLIVVIVAVVGLMVIDHLQAVVVGVLAGMIAPTLTGDRWNGRVTALGVFAAVHFIPYIAGAFTAALIVPFLLDALAQGETLIVVGGLLVLIAAFCVPREALIGWLWREVVGRLNASAEEIEAVFR